MFSKLQALTVPWIHLRGEIKIIQVELKAGVKMVLAKEMLCRFLVDDSSVSFSGNRPLVLNFGSCTWPSFLFKFDQFKRLIEDFSSIADFLIIYIEEAHASGTERFPVSTSFCPVFSPALLPRLGVGRGMRIKGKSRYSLSSHHLPVPAVYPPLANLCLCFPSGTQNRKPGVTGSST